MSLAVRVIKIGALPAVEIETEDAVAQLTPYGAHVLSYRTFADDSETDVLWISDKAEFTPGKAIRGGIPVCWPWFGKAGTPAHGLARINVWQMSEVTEEADGSASLFFTLTLEELKLKARMDVNIGKALTLQLTTWNNSDTALSLTEALHTYFTAGQIEAVSVTGLDGCSYTEFGKKAVQKGAVTFDKETDRIYQAERRVIVIEDPVLDRKIAVERFGSDTAVVWNPWTEKAAAMADFGNDEFHGMLCVEAANAGDDVRMIPPGGTHTIGTRITVL